MEQSDLLFKNVGKKGDCFFQGKKDCCSIVLKGQYLNGHLLRKLQENSNFILATPFYKSLVIVFKCKSIVDDAIVQHLEIILAYLMENRFRKITLDFSAIDPTSAHIESLRNSVFARDHKDKNDFVFENNKEKYLTNYYMPSYSDVNYFRYYIKKNTANSVIGIILQNTVAFLGYHCNDKSHVKLIAKAFTEMIDNVRHAEADCIATFKLNDHLIDSRNNQKVSGFFLNVVDISNCCIYSNLKSEIESDSLLGNNKRIIEKSYPYHRERFNDEYTFERYCFVTVFQKRITTSSGSGETGGTGLTDLINMLLKTTVYLHSYAMSGNDVLYFKDELIRINDDGTVGFNESGNYYDDIPSASCFDVSPFYYPGTLFLLEVITR